MPWRACTPATSSSWLAMFGAVMPLVLPSWLMPEPITVARIGSPSRCASARRFSTTAPTPSPGTKPFAASSKVLQRPSADSMPDEHISR